MKELFITVVNDHHTKEGEYIGRGSPLGNPYRLQEGEPRGSTIERYRAYLQDKIEVSDPIICNELNRLAYLAQTEPLKIRCFCAPKPCHGDVIREILINALRNK